MFLLIEDRIAARSAERSALGHNVHSDGQFQAGLERSTLFDRCNLKASIAQHLDYRFRDLFSLLRINSVIRLIPERIANGSRH